MVFCALQLWEAISRGLKLVEQDGMLDRYGTFLIVKPESHSHLLQAVNFLNTMAFEVELDAPGNAKANGLTRGDDTGDNRFKPMNRKWAP